MTRSIGGRPDSTLVATAFAALVGLTAAASAQAPGCEKIKSLLLERQSIVTGLNAKKNQKIDPKVACGAFGRLVNNGAATLKWIAANKTWCQIPDTFMSSIQADNVKAATIRGKACQVAAQRVALEKKARERGPAGTGQLGGNGLTGEMKIPQGAL